MQVKRKLVAVSVYALFVTLVSPLPSAVHASDGPRASATVGHDDFSGVTIGNFGRINANYYRGEQPEGREYADLAALGIKTVIDLQADGDNDNEAQLVEAAGMRFYRIPMTSRVPPTPAQIREFLQIVTDQTQQPVFVHCAGGRHRTGVMTAVYRMEQDGWTPEQAYREMKKYKFGASVWHPELKKFVLAYRLVRGRQENELR